jgi:hypothetical protein
MTASALFQVFNALALLGWIVLAAAVFLRRNWWRDAVSGTYVPVLLSAAYTALIALFFFQAPGGFDSLDNVQRLFMGVRAARGFEDLSLPRWPLIVILPLTFMFGPAGYLAFEIIKTAVTRSRASQAV